MSFMEDDGYSRPEFWLSDGWSVVMAQGWQAPLYWFRDPRSPSSGSSSPSRACDPSTPMNPSATSATTRRTRSRIGPASACPPRRSGRPWPAAPARGPTSSVSRPRIPAGRLPPMRSWATSGSGHRARTPPYPGFRAAPGAVGEYNGKFMVSQYVLRGGCCATPPGHARVHLPQLLPTRERAGPSAACDWHRIPDRP